MCVCASNMRKIFIYEKSSLPPLHTLDAGSRCCSHTRRILSVLWFDGSHSPSPIVRVCTPCVPPVCACVRGTSVNCFSFCCPRQVEGKSGFLFFPRVGCLFHWKLISTRSSLDVLVCCVCSAPSSSRVAAFAHRASHDASTLVHPVTDVSRVWGMEGKMTGGVMLGKRQV